MSTPPNSDETDALRVELEVLLDRRPIVGALRTKGGFEERFVGWLGFVGALTRARESAAGQTTPARPAGRG
jgi:hypothetical protein